MDVDNNNGLDTYILIAIIAFMVVVAGGVWSKYIWKADSKDKQPVEIKQLNATEDQSSKELEKPIQKYSGPKKRIAVLDFEVKVHDAQENVGQGLGEMLITSLLATGSFTVLERASIVDIANEQKMALDGLIKPGTEARVGELLGTQLLIKGVVTEFSETNQAKGIGVAVKGAHVGKNVVEGHVAIDIRIFDANTGVILESHRSEAKVSKSSTEFTLNTGGMAIGGAGFSKTPIGEASRKVIEDAVGFISSRMENTPWAGKIALVKDNNIYINAGKDVGFKIGDFLEVYQKGEEIFDPDASVPLGYQATNIGYAKISSVDDRFSTAQIITVSSGVKKGDIVKFLEDGIPTDTDLSSLDAGLGNQQIAKNIVKVKLSGIQSFGQLIQFERTMQNMIEIKGFQRKNYSQGEAMFETELSGDVNKFAERLYSQEFSDFGIDVMEVTSGTLEVQIR